MFQFPGFPLAALFIHAAVTGHDSRRVSPFGYLRIEAYLRLPAAFRSWSRPSSANGALASTLCSSLLDFLLLRPFFLFCLRCPLPLSASCPSFRISFPLPASAFLHLRLVFQKNSFLLHVQLSRFGAPHSFGAFRADPENDTASKFFERQSVLFALSSTAFSDRSTLGCALRVSPSDSSLERR